VAASRRHRAVVLLRMAQAAGLKDERTGRLTT
jgi:hypothetical protein